MKNKIKIALLLDSHTINQWEHQLIKELIKLDDVSINLVILNTMKTPPSSQNWKTILYDAYLKLDKYVFKVKANAFEKRNIEETLNMVERMTVSPLSQDGINVLSSKEVSQIKSKNLDIIIQLGSKTVKGDILNASSYAMWSYLYSDNRLISGQSDGFWEVLNGIGVTGSVLEIVTNNSNKNRVIARTSSKTDELSISRNRNTYAWKLASFLPRKVKELTLVGEKDFFKEIDYQYSYPQFYSNRLYHKTNLNNLEMFSLLLQHLFKIFKTKLYHKFVLEQWILLFEFKEEVSSSFAKFKKLIPPKDRFYADPFVVYENNKYYLFIEELPYITNKGHISVLEINKKGEWSEPVKIIDESYHLSYPYIFKEHGNYFIIPESGANRTIDLYKCTKFPFQWEFQMNLMNNIRAVDTTLFFYEKKCWMFCNMAEHKGASTNDELFLFYADKVETVDWTPHPLNPIVSDATKSRPAGKIFIYNDKIIRPSQNSSKLYGYGLTMNEILVLNEHEYKEVRIEDIEPNWDRQVTRTHTFNHSEGLTIIDGKLKRKR